jgi:hypothetical protein
MWASSTDVPIVFPTKINSWWLIISTREFEK